ncbi:hypothetical protein BDN72DRAFT_810959 [Pluteus cervinus]|uniref:Uncharacterized protein n=1 Tax=Pluteus cervinus TaxID=181527 RepID=A0ACD3BEC8_9AGAR|nr:hypothetical protein BDN72DRAFT_810959 [Pluteus cervinus]
MSSSLASPLRPQLTANTTLLTPKATSITPIDSPQPSSAVVIRPLSQIVTPVWEPPAHWNAHQVSASVSSSRTRNLPGKKLRSEEEQEITKRVASRFASRLAADHVGVLHPDVDTPFTDTLDVVKRLLPYHVYHQPRDDLATMLSLHKGKMPETPLQAEISETKFALECFKRRDALEKRFRKARIKQGSRDAPDDQYLMLTQSILEADRSEVMLLNAELRTARSELERLEREKRAASQPARSVYTPAQSPTTTMQSPYYRTYPYAYAQPYGTPMTASSTSMFSVATANPSTNYTPYQTSGAIPVQLPVASLPALHALGIVPVPASSLTPQGPQPPAVLRGSSANGAMLSLEINVSLLQSAQMSGLAMVLNSLMSRSATAAAASTPPATASVASTQNSSVTSTPVPASSPTTDASSPG